jgi:hypothetical protein
VLSSLYPPNEKREWLFRDEAWSVGSLPDATRGGLGLGSKFSCLFKMSVWSEPEAPFTVRLSYVLDGEKSLGPEGAFFSRIIGLNLGHRKPSDKSAREIPAEAQSVQGPRRSLCYLIPNKIHKRLRQPGWRCSAGKRATSQGIPAMIETAGPLRGVHLGSEEAELSKSEDIANNMVLDGPSYMQAAAKLDWRWRLELIRKLELQGFALH